MKRTSILCLIIFFSLNSFSQDTILFENFTGYIDTSGTYTVPTGWTISSNGSYTTSFVSSNSGQPSYKFDSSNDSIISPAFAGADTLQFWLKGASTDTISALIILESADNLSWDTLAFIDKLPTSSTYIKFGVQSSSVRLRFRFVKSMGNLGFDDVLLTGPKAITADFSAQDACMGDTSCLSDLSNTILGTITSWEWDFGDGSSDTVQNPCHVYASAGSYAIQLRVVNSNSDTAIVVKSITIGAFPLASFNPADTSACLPLVLNYFSTSTISEGTISEYLWDFGNSITDTASQPTITFSNAGTYNISLIASSPLGCADTAFGTVLIFSNPQIDTSGVSIISPNCGASDGSIAGIMVSGNTAFTYNWSPVSQTAIDLSNAPAGTYVFQVSDVNNCSATMSFVLANPGAPNVSLSSSTASICEGDTVIFNASPSGLNNYTFYLNGVSVQDSTLNSYLTTSLTDGDTITAIATDAGCTSSPSNAISIAVNPVADATIDPAGPFCNSDTPVNLAAMEAGGIWVGSGITNSTAGTFNPSVAGPGTHTITYLIGGVCGDTATVTIVVNQNTDATINAAGPFCESDSAILLIAVENGGVWSGDGIIDSIAGTFSPSAASEGMHTIMYSISGVCGDTGIISITVNPNPEAGFSFQGIICDSVLFSDTSKGNPVSWFWNFGDSTTSTEQNPTHLFPLYWNYYSVFLTVTDINGCSNTFNNDSVIDFCGSVAENAFAQSIIISPNPSTGIISIQPSFKENLNIKICNIIGEIIYSSENNRIKSAIIDLSAQGEGNYFMTIYSKEAIATKKIVIVR